MITSLIHFLKHVKEQGSDFSEEGFILREVESTPIRIFTTPRMWVGKMGWSSNRRGRGIVRCYHEGFSFWPHKVEDAKEWYCEYTAIVGSKKPLGLSFADPILTIAKEGKEADCMLGEAAKFILPQQALRKDNSKP